MHASMAANDRGKYKLIAELGQGGMANVYLAVARGPSGFNKLVVMKSLRSDLAVDQELMAMFLEEARLAARLNHPHVVQTYEVGDYAGRPVIIMEYLEGQTLANVELRGKARLTLALRLRILVDALEGLHHAHELTDFSGKPLGLVHRDVSPQNVFVTFDGHVKVLDFGIAKVVNSQVQTATGILKGKVRYMAPEQMLGSAELDCRADLYSIGVMLWEAITGLRMWQGQSDMQVMTGVAQGVLPTPRSANPGVSENLEAICLRALSRDPNDRYPTALEMASALERELDNIGTGAHSRQLGQLVRELFEDVRARTRATIEAQLLEVTAHPDSSSSQAIPANLINISTRISEDSPSGASGKNGPFSAVTAREGSGRSRIAAWVAAALVAVGAGGIGFAKLGHSTRAAEPATPAAVASPSSANPPAASAVPTVSAPVPPAPARASSVTVELSANPARAALFLDGHLLPSNPYTTTLPSDGSTHKVYAEAAGYLPRTIPLTADHDADVKIVLDPLRPGTLRAAAPPAPPPPQPSSEASSQSKSNRCSPPYVIDADGIKHFRPECLAQ